jgi:hypothetical protein
MWERVTRANLSPGQPAAEAISAGDHWFSMRADRFGNILD